MKRTSSTREKKRKHSHSDERSNNWKRTESSVEKQEPKDELADAELDRIGSDIEEGGLDLSTPFQPISAYITDRREMMEQCFRVLGEKKLQKMLSDELKDCSLEEIKQLCWEQLKEISETNLIQILAGEELTSGNANENAASQQDNNVDSTSSIKESAKRLESKQEAGGSGEESDVLSINADAYDSDIEGPKEEPSAKTEDAVVKLASNSDPAANPDPANAESQPTAAKKDIQEDIDKSVSEILATSSKGQAKEPRASPPPANVVGLPVRGGHVTACPPSVQQLELLELEMRARAIKALMKASGGKKPSGGKQV